MHIAEWSDAPPRAVTPDAASAPADQPAATLWRRLSLDALRAEVRAAATEPLTHIFTVIMLAVAIGGLALTAADIYQRWIGEATWTLDIDGRFNAVTWFHSFVLAGASMSALGLAAAHAPSDRPRARIWLFVGLSFAFLSFDKSISFHERLGQEIEESLGLADEWGRVLWQAVYAPFLAALVFLLMCRALPAGHRLRPAIIVAVALCGAKLALEAFMLPAIELGLTSEAGVLYGLEANLEESLQLLGFGLFFAAFTALLLDALTTRTRSPLPRP